MMTQHNGTEHGHDEEECDMFQESDANIWFVRLYHKNRMKQQIILN